MRRGRADDQADDRLPARPAPTPAVRDCRRPRADSRACRSSRRRDRRASGSRRAPRRPCPSGRRSSAARPAPGVGHADRELGAPAARPHRQQIVGGRRDGVGPQRRQVLVGEGIADQRIGVGAVDAPRRTRRTPAGSGPPGCRSARPANGRTRTYSAYGMTRCTSSDRSSARKASRDAGPPHARRARGGTCAARCARSRCN